MTITARMNLGDLAERMGSDATMEQAQVMRDLLMEAGYEGQDTTDMGEHDWLRLLDQAVDMVDAHA